MLLTLAFALNLLLPLTQGGIPSTAAATAGFVLVSNFEIERQPTDLGDIGSAVDLTADARGLLYLSDALRRLDLETGREQVLVSAKELQEINVRGERGQLLATANPSRFVVVSGSTWSCPWHVQLLTTTPVLAKTLTDRGCGEITLSPSRDRLAVVISETCEGRACGKRRLLVFSTEDGNLAADNPIKPGYVDAYWENDKTFALRYQDHFDAREHHYHYVTASLSEDRGTWQWRAAVPSPKPRVRDTEVSQGRQITLRDDAAIPHLTILAVDRVLGPAPAEYRDDTVRALRSGDRLVIIRRLSEIHPAQAQQPRRREQIAVVKLK